MYTFTLIEVRRGKPVNLISGTLDEIALKLLKKGKQQAAHDVATSTGRITETDFLCIDTSPKKACSGYDEDGYYLTRTGDNIKNDQYPTPTTNQPNNAHNNSTGV